MCTLHHFQFMSECTSQKRTFLFSLLDYVTLLMLLLLLSEVTRCLGLSLLSSLRIWGLLFILHFGTPTSLYPLYIFVAVHRHWYISTIHTATPTPNPTTLTVVFSFIFSIYPSNSTTFSFCITHTRYAVSHFIFFWLTSKHLYHHRLNQF